MACSPILPASALFGQMDIQWSGKTDRIFVLMNCIIAALPSSFVEAGIGLRAAGDGSTSQIVDILSIDENRIIQLTCKAG